MLSTIDISFLAVFLTATATSGCVMRVGPKTIRGDRFDYAGAISVSWKTQTLLNLVKVRYADQPVFLDVAQVVASYTLEASAGLNTPDWSGGTYFPVASVNGRWSENPTITYNPLTGEKFTRSLLAPVSPVSIFQLVQAGWPLDSIFMIAVKSINGLHAASHLEIIKQEADSRFYRVVRLMRELQLTNEISLRVIPPKGKSDDESAKSERAVLQFNRRNLNEADVVKAREVRTLLGLSQEGNQFEIAFGAVQASDKELAMLTRSIVEIIGEASSGVDVPVNDLKEGRAFAVADVPTGNQAPSFGIKVHSSNSKPSEHDVYIAAQYHNHWFWIDDRDLLSKRGLTFIMLVSTLVEPGASIAPPVLTISK